MNFENLTVSVFAIPVRNSYKHERFDWCEKYSAYNFTFRCKTVLFLCSLAMC